MRKPSKSLLTCNPILSKPHSYPTLSRHLRSPCLSVCVACESSAGQEEVFTEVSEFVQSALDGFNVCLFSYGQTGSGKTHTMQGSGAGDMRGMIPRAMEQVDRLWGSSAPVLC